MEVHYSGVLQRTLVNPVFDFLAATPDGVTPNGHLHLPALRAALDTHAAAETVGAVDHDESVIAAWRSRRPPPKFNGKRDNLGQSSRRQSATATGSYGPTVGAGGEWLCGAPGPGRGWPGCSSSADG